MRGDYLGKTQGRHGRETPQEPLRGSGRGERWKCHQALCEDIRDSVLGKKPAEDAGRRKTRSKQ
jgi:hypothetical protein